MVIALYQSLFWINMTPKNNFWWQSSTDECPITLESLSTLPYPPFGLTSGCSTAYFDGLALASYVVSRGIFQNPLTREELTLADCRRLDEYLETYCFQRQLRSISRRISVADAFGLRNVVRVDPGRMQMSQSQARALQSTATAALAGLFVYGNDRGLQEHDVSPTMTSTQQRQDQLLLDWGFDLTRTVYDPNNDYLQEGWTVIDDDEARVVGIEGEAYQAAQRAFPRLVDGETSTSTTSLLSAVINEQALQRIRELSLEEEQTDRERERVSEMRRQRLLQAALARREERKLVLREQLKQRTVGNEKKKQEDEEIQRAKAEIEEWREQQWEKLRQISESQRIVCGNKRDSDNRIHSEDEADEASFSLSYPPTHEEMEASKKEKAAAKRKRANERKKVQRAKEREKQERMATRKALEDRKAASASKCASCGGGILDCGFEKFGMRFCSTNCARTAKSTQLQHTT